MATFCPTQMQKHGSVAKRAASRSQVGALGRTESEQTETSHYLVVTFLLETTPNLHFLSGLAQKSPNLLTTKIAAKNKKVKSMSSGSETLSKTPHHVCTPLLPSPRRASAPGGCCGGATRAAMQMRSWVPGKCAFAPEICMRHLESSSISPIMVPSFPRAKKRWVKRAKRNKLE